jgi:hypothetical protein
LNTLRSLEREETAMTAGRKVVHQPAEEGEAIHHRHLQVEGDHVGAMTHHLLDARPRR